VSDATIENTGTETFDVGEYCRQVEDHLTRVNGGHLVRIIGPGFELVRRWAYEGIPLSLVFHGIDLKAERHRTGKSKRPLRLEFCEADVRAVYENWRRAVGLFTPAAAPEAESDAAAAESHDERKRPSLTRHLDRVIDRLSRAAGRLELPDALRAAIDRCLLEVVHVRDEAKKARGHARADLVARLPAIDERLRLAARDAVSDEEVARLRSDAETDLAAYRGRLSPDTWQRSVDVGLDRMLRDRLGLPTIELGAL
jgi:hypothetical protein